VATRHRSVTQPEALALYRRHPGASGLRWWSIWEALWVNVTVFERAARSLRLVSAHELTLKDPTVLEAADLFGLRVMEAPRLRREGFPHDG
jgi:hypothetical protein